MCGMSGKDELYVISYVEVQSATGRDRHVDDWHENNVCVSYLHTCCTDRPTRTDKTHKTSM